MKQLIFLFMFICGVSIHSQSNLKSEIILLEYLNTEGQVISREMNLENDCHFHLKIVTADSTPMFISDKWHRKYSLSFKYSPNSLVWVKGWEGTQLIYKAKQVHYPNTENFQCLDSSYQIGPELNYDVFVIGFYPLLKSKRSFDHNSSASIQRELKSRKVCKKADGMRIHYSPQIGIVKLEYLNRKGKTTYTESVIAIDGEPLENFIMLQKWILNRPSP